MRVKKKERSLSRVGVASALGQRTGDLENFDLGECSRERVFFFKIAFCTVYGEDILDELAARRFKLYG